MPTNNNMVSPLRLPNVNVTSCSVPCEHSNLLYVYFYAKNSSENT